MTSPPDGAADMSMSDEGLFERILQTNHHAFALGRFNTAYHALAAAMHEAKDEKDVARLEQVARLVSEQITWIDANAPDYEHSTRSCQARHSTSIYTLLEQQTMTNVRLMLRATGS